MNEQLFHVGVKALLQNSRGMILLMRQDVREHSIPTGPYWDLPGGRIERGEHILKTLEREMSEETGIEDIKEPEFYMSVISNHLLKLPGGELIGLVLMVYKVSVSDDVAITLSDEHTAYEWVDPEDAAARLANKYPPEFTAALAADAAAD